MFGGAVLKTCLDVLLVETFCLYWSMCKLCNIVKSVFFTVQLRSSAVFFRSFAVFINASF